MIFLIDLKKFCDWEELSYATHESKQISNKYLHICQLLLHLCQSSFQFSNFIIVVNCSNSLVNGSQVNVCAHR